MLSRSSVIARVITAGGHFVEHPDLWGGTHGEANYLNLKTMNYYAHDSSLMMTTLYLVILRYSYSAFVIYVGS